MSKTVNERLSALREVMQREHLAAFIFPSTDPHNGEYVPDHWKGREWISGFNGSAGTAVVTMDSAALWTDSRYFLAAEEQLKGTEFQLMKLKIPGTPTIPQWLGEQLRGASSTEVGVDGMVNSFASVKLQRIRKALRGQHADGMLVSALDDIAWVLNLRGTDVHCTPLFVSYLLISTTSTTLYINKEKLTPEVTAYLKSNGIAVDDYANVAKGLKDYFEYNILLDPQETSYTLFKTVKCQEIIRMKSPIPAMKAIKNETEIVGFRNAMLKDGIALVKFLKWLQPAVEAGGQTEMSLDEKLTALRAEQDGFRGLSFDTIAGYEHHGAIIHYEATPETDIPVEPKGVILIDSGAQYDDGTTDVTRTIALGPVTEEQRHIYTLVLKGHIQLELCKFPIGAAGTQMDILARMAMWREGLNYLHGTGHGVGQYLSVHEGPHQFRMEWMPAPFLPGMTVTDEPGIYLPGKFGVRIENTLLIVPYIKTEFGEFLQFESLTLCPIDTSLIDLDMMLPEEIDWLNNYHDMVYEKLSPYLTEDEKEWLREATKAV